ncbi:cupin domain-containing protein [Gordonia sp. i37]|uniref:cupin domain-containing protein n=1 Tax=Gordonia sp. i37 TaxID=1961707 RepID=UPI0009AE3F6F|nr:cupin domain-containing protein [Gordonia sp. i37]OPX14862.1 cupin [Gordonia sp. i37]
MLERCIAIDPDVFAREHWGRSPLLSRAVDLPRDFVDLLSPGAVDELLAERGVRTPFIRMAKEGTLLARERYVGPAGFGAEMPDQVDSAKVLAQFADGATIVLQGLHRLWPPVIDLVRGLVDDLGHPVQANAYVTPPSNRGFDPHYDVHDVFVLQISGEKQWTVHAPVHLDPVDSQPWTDHREDIQRRTDDPPVIDTVLRSGDALYLPRGWVHSARALGTTSIHLTIGTAALTALDVLGAVVEQLTELRELRESLPMGIDLTDPDATAALVGKTLSAALEAVRDRSTEIESGAAEILAHRHADRTRPASVRPLATVEALSNPASVGTVQWRQGLAAVVVEVAGRVELRLPDRTMSFPGFCADALVEVRRGTAVRGDRLPGLDAADGEVLLRRLLREAVVAPTPRSTETEQES